MLFACCVMCVPNDVPVFSGESAEQFFPDWGRLRWVRSGGIAPEVLAEGVCLSPRRGGAAAAAGRRKQVKKLLQEFGIPPLLRKQWPLLLDGAGKLLALPGVAVSSDCYDPAGYWPEWLPD
jgi:tRNA(Ile)-lysidine synthase